MYVRVHPQDDWSSAAKTTSPGRPTTRPSGMPARGLGATAVFGDEASRCELGGPVHADAGWARPHRPQFLDKDNVYVVTGDSGTGLTHGTIAGRDLPEGNRQHGGPEWRRRRNRPGTVPPTAPASAMSAGSRMARRTETSSPSLRVRCAQVESCGTPRPAIKGDSK